MKCASILKIKNKICLNGDILFFTTRYTKVLNGSFSIFSFGHFAVKKFPNFNDYSTLNTLNYFPLSKSPINFSLMLKKTHAEPCPTKT